MRNNRSTVLSAVVMLLFTSMGAGGHPKNSQDDSERLIKSVKFLEEKPLDKAAKDIRSWALTWVIQTDKVNVKVCSLIVSGVDKKYKYSGEIFGQYTIAIAGFKLANPDQANNEDAAQLAGIQSALSSYEAIIKEQPKGRNDFLDGLVARRVNGSLPKYVAENNCKDKT